MRNDCSEDYQSAIRTINKFQTKVPVNPLPPSNKGQDNMQTNLKRSCQFFKRIGHDTEELDGLKAIHIAGSKGKGSVSAMCESILRKHGFKTGLLTSPHLIEVRERIRLNGHPLSRAQFAKHFWQCYSRLDSTKKSDFDMPNYYRFFTLMALHVFVVEQVDVAIVEVGKGGAYDTTNIICNPAVCGITLLDYDHVNELGDTLGKIMWHKAGICKPGHPVFSVPQEREPLEVLATRAKELQASSVEVVPSLEEYPGEKVVIGIAGDHHKYNASLAVQLCRKWLQLEGMWTAQHNGPVSPADLSLVKRLGEMLISETFLLNQHFYDGLRLCRWAGRSQIEKRNGITFYLDAAHTPLSVKACTNWFQHAAAEEAKSKGFSTVRVLLFNFLGDRDAKVLLQPLLACEFDYALFAPSFTGIGGTNTTDQTYMKATKQSQYERSQENEQVWLELNCAGTTDHIPDHPLSRQPSHKDSLCENGPETSLNHPPSKQALEDLHNPPCENGQCLQDSQHKQAKTRYFPCLDKAIQWCSVGRGLNIKTTSPPSEDLFKNEMPPADFMNADHVQVLVTGSVRLVGTVMYVLDCSVE